MRRWNASLGEVAVPLGPQRVRAVREIKRVDNLAPLPPVVARRLRPSMRVRCVRNLPQPRPSRVDGIDVECQRFRP